MILVYEYSIPETLYVALNVVKTMSSHTLKRKRTIEVASWYSIGDIRVLS